MEDIKLFYFDIRGRGEFIRMVLTAGGVNFEDVRITFADWKNDPSHKKETPYGQIPYVIYKGKKYGQSIPITSFFAKKLGFLGKTEEDALRQEEVMNLVEDLRVPYIRDWILSSDEDEKAELVQKMKTELFPRFLDYFEALLKDNGDQGFFVGNSVMAADMYLYDFLETVLGIDEDALKNFPLLQKLVSNVNTFPALKDYFANRPKTAF